MRDAPIPSRPHLRATLLACACLFTLSACASGSQSVRPTEVLVDTADLSAGKEIAGAITQPGAPALTSWWTAWGDPQLDRLIASGAVTAPSIAEAAARMRRAAAGVDAASADRLPTIEGFGRAVGERFPDHSVYPAPYAGDWGSEGSLTASASYALDFWGRRREAQGAATAHLDVAQAEAADATLLKMRIKHRGYPTASDGLNALRRGAIDAFVFDKALLAWTIRQNYSSAVQLLDTTFDPQNYAFVLPNGSPLRKPVTVALLTATQSDWWKEASFRYLGTKE